MLLDERVGQVTTEAEAVRFALDLYGLEVAATTLPGEYDDNFYLTTIEKTVPENSASQFARLPCSSAAPRPEGSAFVLKVMHPAREQSLIDLQCRALQHLAARAPHLNLPRVCLTKNGEAFAAVTSADGASRLAWLLTYMPGAVLAGAKPLSADLLASLGALLGELDTALADFSHPGAQRELKWDFARA